MGWLSWILGAAGVLGVGGTIAALVLAPAVAIPVLSRLVSAILSCKPCLIGIAVVAAFLAGGLYGHGVATSNCREQELAAQLRNRATDLAAAQDAARAADEALTASARQIEDSEKRLADYEERLKKRPNDSCALRDDDFDHRVRTPAGRTR